jgi:hypothetical protein
MEIEAVKERKVLVKTSPGMFSNEVIATLGVADGSTVSFFVDKSLLIERKEESAFLKLPLVKRHEVQEIDVVALPVETIETGARWIELALG